MSQYATDQLKIQIENEQAQLVKAQDRKLAATRDIDAKRVDAEITRLEGRLDELRGRIKVERSAGSADPLGDMLLQQFGWPVAATKFWSIFAFLLAVEICASAGFYGYLTEEPPAQAKSVSPNSPKPTPAPAPPQKRGAAGIKARERTEAKTDQQAHASRFLDYLLERFGEAKTIAAGNIFSVYAMWCARVKETPLDNRKIGLALSTLGCYRNKDIYVLPLPKAETPAEKAASPPAS